MSRSPHTPILLLSVLLGGCGKGGDTAGRGSDAPDTASGWRPDVACPGDAGCATNAGPLRAGAAIRDVTPTCFELWDDADGDATWDVGVEEFFDCGCDQLCDGDAGYAGPDEGEGDGVFQAIWLAGFGNARPANGVHDPIEARALVLESGDTRVGLVTLDVVGWFYEDAMRVRDAAAAADLDHLVVQATHNHEGPDTMGQWGLNLTESGKDAAYIDAVVALAAEAIVEAAGALEPATLRIADVNTATPFGDKGTANLIRDTRDPVIIDEMMAVAHFADAGGDTIATFINWGNHPEVLGSDNLLLTSDYPHYARRGLEEGVQWGGSSAPGLGGVALFSSGTVGGLMTPLGVTVTDPDGTDHSGDTFEKAEVMGKLLAHMAIEAVQAASPVDDPVVSIAASQLYLPVHNDALRLAQALGVLDRELYNYDPELAINDLNRPEVRTEVSLIDIGPLRMLGVPGELMPELSIGGYDGSRVNSSEYAFLNPDNEHPPDVAQAPAGPYFEERMGGRVNLILGLANDELGYLVPPYDFVVDATLPYLDQAPGDHYEETNSLGPDTVPLITELVDQLIDYQPAP